MKKKKPAVIAIMMCVMFAISCGGKQQNDRKNADIHTIVNEVNTESKKFPERVEKILSSGIKADAEIEIPKEINSSQIKKYKVGIQKLDVEKLYDRFMGAEEIEEESSQPAADSIEEGFQYYAKSGSHLTGDGNGFVIYSVPEYDDIRLTGYLADKEEASLMDREFPFETRKGAEEKIHEFFREMGISVNSSSDCYAIDYNWMQQQYKLDEALKKELTESGKIEKTRKKIIWDKDLNCYLFVFRQEIDHIPVTNQMRDVKNIGISAPYIYVVYSKNGIAQCMISDLFAVTETIEEGFILDLDQALELLDQKYNSIIMEGEYTLTKIRLEYVPDLGNSQDEYTLIPAWRFYMVHRFESPSKEDERKLEMNEIPSEVLFDAMDGTEIITGVGI